LEKNSLEESCPKTKLNLEKEEAWKLDFVRKKMRETGFQLEDRVRSIFADGLADCDIEQTYYFSDWQSSEERELDFKISYKVAEYPIRIVYIFLVECKQLPDNYWVFVKSHQDRLLFKNSISLWDNVGRVGRQESLIKILDPLNKIDELACDSYARRYKEFWTSRNHKTKSAKSNKRQDNIKSTEIVLAKAYYSEKRNAMRINEMIKQSIKKPRDRVEIFYPMVVFQGNLLESDMSFEPPKVRFIRNSHLYHFSIQNNEDVNMIIDVVEINHLATFIQDKILPEMKQLKRQLARFQDSYITHIEEILEGRLSAQA
jgi:hypothetical protein